MYIKSRIVIVSVSLAVNGRNHLLDNHVAVIFLFVTKAPAFIYMHVEISELSSKTDSYMISQSFFQS